MHLAIPSRCAGSTKREPTVVGKPAEFMLENIAQKFGLRREQVGAAPALPFA